LELIESVLTNHIKLFKSVCYQVIVFINPNQPNVQALTVRLII
jgi:hypothetical protein